MSWRSKRDRSKEESALLLGMGWRGLNEQTETPLRAAVTSLEGAVRCAGSFTWQIRPSPAGPCVTSTGRCGSAHKSVGSGLEKDARLPVLFGFTPFPHVAH